ncbi:unnamed protein product, partial [Oppiella nova]
DINRDFCDVLIAAKLKAICEDKESAQYFTDENLSSVMIDLFIAGVETSMTTLLWMILLMIRNPNIQRKLRDEIHEKLNDNVPVISDKVNLDYVMAYINETLRYPIPANTYVIVDHGCILMDENNWKNADQFNPDRFLDDQGKYGTVKPAAFIPFSTGRRLTNDYELKLVNEDTVTLDPEPSK